MQSYNEKGKSQNIFTIIKELNLLRDSERIMIDLSLLNHMLCDVLYTYVVTPHIMLSSISLEIVSTI